MGVKKAEKCHADILFTWQSFVTNLRKIKQNEDELKSALQNSHHKLPALLT